MFVITIKKKWCLTGVKKMLSFYTLSNTVKSFAQYKLSIAYLSYIEINKKYISRNWVVPTKIGKKCMHFNKLKQERKTHKKPHL